MTASPKSSSALVRRRMSWAVCIALLISSIVGITAFAQIRRPQKPEVWGFKVVATYPHDPAAFTQGLVFTGGHLYEGTGKKGESSLRQVDLATGKVEKFVPLNEHYFGEGITVLGSRIYQLTWQNRIGVVFDAETFNVEKTFQYTGEGWGLTTDGTNLLMSDGSATIRFLDPKTFQVVKRISVRSGQGKVDKLNELEYVKGEIWANIWYEDKIARISPETGEVVGWIDLNNLYPRGRRRSDEDVLNGIAYDAENDRLFVTGKNWPQLFEIKTSDPTAGRRDARRETGAK